MKQEERVSKRARERERAAESSLSPTFATLSHSQLFGIFELPVEFPKRAFARRSLSRANLVNYGNYTGKDVWHFNLLPGAKKYARH